MNQEEQWLLSEKYNGQKTEGFLSDCKRLSDGEPLAYIIGSIPFLDCIIFLDSHPLIPRPETEFWTKHLIDEIVKVNTSPEPISVLDLCAGSGASGVAVAQSTANTLVDFGEIDALHLPTILHNLTHNNINPDRCNILQSDLFSKIEKKYHYILSNPPYIDPAIDRAETSVKLHEPHLALYGGIEGMELIRQIISEAPTHLHSNGQLWIEHEPEQSKAIQILGTKHGFEVVTHPDQYEVERYSVLNLL